MIPLDAFTLPTVTLKDVDKLAEKANPAVRNLIPALRQFVTIQVTNQQPATIPDAVIAAFASPGDVQLKPAYTLAQALDDKDMAKAITAMARQVAKEQAARREAGTIARGLEPYVRTGWILPAEVPVVVDRGARRNARRWARTGGRSSARAMRTFQANAASLGLDQVMMSRVGRQEDRVAHDRELLEGLGEARREFLRATRTAAAQAGMGA